MKRVIVLALLGLLLGAPAFASSPVAGAVCTLTGSATAGDLVVFGTLGTGSATCVDAGATANAQATPANPTGTASLTGVMMGLAGAITPTSTGKLMIVVSGTIFNPTGVGDGAKVQIRYGTGTAPANAAALTGTAVGAAPQYVASTTAGKSPFAVNAVVTGLTVNTAVWIDLSLTALTAGTATINDVSISAQEIR